MGGPQILPLVSSGALGMKGMKEVEWFRRGVVCWVTTNTPTWIAWHLRYKKDEGGSVG